MCEGGFAKKVLACETPAGGGEISLELGRWRIRVAGLDGALVSGLASRWRPFVAEGGGACTLLLRAVRGAPGLWLPHWERMERYRVEGTLEGGRPCVRSYHFAMTPEDDPRAWRLALADAPDEPAERIVENAVRCAVVRLAASEGGLAIHAAGALREGRAYLLAGPSRSGKTTAVALSRGVAEDLGDDLAVILPEGGAWAAPALPFASFEQAPPKPPGSLFPVAGIFRLFRAEEPRLEELTPVLATASLVSCAALPHAIPDLADAVLECARRYVDTGRFAHLHFRRTPDFWRLLDPRGGG